MQKFPLHGNNFKNAENVSLEKSSLLLIVFISLYHYHTMEGTVSFIKNRAWADVKRGKFSDVTDTDSGK
jgi:hypothetical protein